MHFGERITERRLEQGLTREQLAERMNVSAKAVSKWESEQATPDLDKVVIMSEIFEVTTDYLLKGIEPVEVKDHKTMADVVDGKILTEKNGKRAKSVLKWVLIGLGAFLTIDVISLIVFLLLNGGFPA